jgi:hypothetical protein
VNSWLQRSWWEIDDEEERALNALTVAITLEQRSSALTEESAAIDLYEGEREEEPSVAGEAVDVTNTVQSLVDSFVSDVVNNRIRVQVLTDKGKWEDREKAQEMSRAVEAIFDDAGLYDDEGTEICRDGFVCPMGGAVKVTPDYESNRIAVERISAARLYVDERDARMGKPRTLVYADDFAPEVVAAKFPKHAQELMDLADSMGTSIDFSDVNDSGNVIVSRRVKVYEIYHLPSSEVDSSDRREWGLETKKEPTHDGTHMVVCGDLNRRSTIVLHEGPWAVDCFPFVVFRPYKRMRGWSGHALSERLASTQRQIDRIQDRIKGIADLYSRVMLYVNKDAQVSPAAVTNDWSRVIEGKGPAANAISVINQNAVPPELFGYLSQIIDWTYEFRGKTDLSMRGAKPPGISSGVGLRMLTNEEAIRHTTVFRAWETFGLALFRVVIEMACLVDMVTNGAFEVFWGSDDELRKIKWSQINLRRDRFKLRRWPVNYFSQTPAAKAEKMLELKREGLVNPSQVLISMASDFPDVRALVGDQNALLNNIERKLSMVIRDKSVTAASQPHAFMALDLAKQVGMARYNDLEADGAPDEVIAAIARWLDMVDAEIAKQKNNPGLEMTGIQPNVSGGSPGVPGQQPVPGQMGSPGTAPVEEMANG